MFSRNNKLFYLLYAVTLALGKNKVFEMKVGKVHGGFEWKNCNTTAVPLFFSTFSVQPDPVRPGFPFKTSFLSELTQTVGTTNTLRVDLDITLTTQKTPIDLCSYAPFSEFCHMENVCKVLEQHREKCKDMIALLGIDCKCPFKQKKYIVRNLTRVLPEVPIDGLFHVEAKLTESNHTIGCLELNICIGYEPHCAKIKLWRLSPVLFQISLQIRAVWSVSILFAYRFRNICNA